jgi:predicted ATPase/DNA-binding SARP family transcriptional activator
MNESLEIAMLGGLRIRRGGVPVGELSLRKAEALFAYLACNRRPYAREELAELLWDERSPAQGLASLRMLLTSLRPQLGPYLVISRASIAFDTAQPYWLDVAALDAHLDAAYAGRERGAALDPAALARLEQATALYAGPFLQGFYVRDSSNFEEWMLREQERLERRVRGALHDLVAAALARHTYQEGITHALRLLQLDPLHEETSYDLMQLLALSGQRRAALEQYAACKQVLEAELGVAPTEATTALAARIQAGEFDPPGTVGPDTAGAARPARREQLPVQLSSFVGREAELARLAAHLTDPASRLVTVIGLGGSGKTRLAVEVAPTLPGFPDGIYFVPLASVPAPEFLVSAIGEALDLTFAGPEEPNAQLLSALREKHLLLVLDSFEHLLDGVALLVELLQAAPRLKLLVTAREPLQLAAEQVFDLAGLAVPPAETGPQVEQAPAVQLFVQRARRGQPQFALDPTVTPWVVRITRLVEGLPLGLELAAGWVRGQSCRMIAQELERSLDVLATTQRDVPPRHRSLRAVFDQSWQRLTADEQAALRRLAVFRGGFDDEAAQAVAGAGVPWPRAILPALVQQSLVRHTPTGRYELHELVRQYAAEKLAAEPEEAETTRARHTAYYLALAEQAKAHLHGPAQAHWLARLEQEHDNLREVLAWGTGAGDSAAALQLAAALGEFWQVHGHLGEGRAWLAAALADPPPDRARPPGRARGRALRWAGVLAREQGELTEAVTWLQASRSLARRGTEQREQGLTLVELGAVYRVGGDFATARTLLEQGLALLRAVDDPVGRAAALINLGQVAFGQGDVAAAQALYEEGLALQRALGDTFGIGNTLLQRGNVAYYRGDAGAARALYTEALALERAVGDKQGTAMALHNLGMLAQSEGDYAAARAYLEEDLALFRAMGHKPGLAHSLFTLGQGATLQQDYAEARTLLDESLRLWREVGNPLGLAFALAERGLVAVRQGENRQAAQCLRESLRICRDQGEPGRAALCLLGLAGVAAAGGAANDGAEPAARLAGAAAGVLERLGGGLEPAYRALDDELRRDLPARLGEPAFAAEWAAGRGMTMADAVAYALSLGAEEGGGGHSNSGLPPYPINVLP